MFSYHQNSLYVEKVPIKKIAKAAGTPIYIYSQAKLLENFRKFDLAFHDFPHLICFALKANSNLSLARCFRKVGAGADIVSGGELFRALRAGFSPRKIVFSGVGKTREEMRYALSKNILMFNVESIEELKELNAVAKSQGVKAPIAIRVNPDLPVDTHHHIRTGTAENKFGIHKKYIFEAYRLTKNLKSLHILGIQAHIGSQITSVAPFLQLLKILLELAHALAKEGIVVRYLDIGGGLGISYRSEEPPSPADLAKQFRPLLAGKNFTLLFEPGRFLVGNAGILVTRVLYRKNTARKNFVIVDAAMNDLARPALYDAYHEIVPVTKHGGIKKIVDVVGPICESGDYFAKNRKLPYPKNGDLLAIENTGAYGFSMSSQYNSRPRAAEVLVKGKKWEVIRRRETYEDLIRGEN